MKKMSLLVLIIVFSPIVLFAQEKIEAPAWNIGDKWFFTQGNIEVVNADQNSYTLNFSDDTCKFHNQGFKTIVFEKTTLNRVGVIDGGKRKEYRMGLRRILNFPLYDGKQWKDGFSGKRLFAPFKGALESYTETFTILGWEELRVQAGKFRSIKLEYKCITAYSVIPFMARGFEMKSTFWYSPAVKYLVKGQYDKSYPDELKDWELVSFKHKK